jgi:hypothetical protein
MTDLELLRIEVVVRRAVTAVLEREMPIAMAVRAADLSERAPTGTAGATLLRLGSCDR